MTSTTISRRRFIERFSLAAAAMALNPLEMFAHLPPQRLLGVAIAGLGGYSSRQLAPALKSTRFCRLAGVITGCKEKGRQWAKTFGFSENNIYGYDNMHEMADNKDIDIVYVVTPNGLHAQHAIAAASAGKHVICERPMAGTVAECDQVIAACKKAGVKLSVGYRLHFDPYYQELMRLAKENDFGSFMDIHGDRGIIMPGKTWRTDKTLAGGGPLMDLGGFIIQGACMAANAMPIAVTAREMRKTKPELFANVEEGIKWIMEFPGDANCTAKTGYQYESDRFRATGTKGWIEFTQHAFTHRGTVVETSKGPLNFIVPNPQALQLDDFVNCILSNKESKICGEMGRRDLLIIEAIYKSAATGKRVLLEQPNRTDEQMNKEQMTRE